MRDLHRLAIPLRPRSGRSPSHGISIWQDRAVDDDAQGRVAANEARLREVNEAIERGQWPGEESERVGFRCECARLGCDQVIELTIREYERVRAHPRRFVLAEDHEVPAAESVAESGAGWAVVEKGQRAGEVAQDTDPRS